MLCAWLAAAVPLGAPGAPAGPPPLRWRGGFNVGRTPQWQLDEQRRRLQREAAAPRPPASPAVGAAALFAAVSKLQRPGSPSCNCIAAMPLLQDRRFEMGPEPPVHPGCRCRHERALSEAGRRMVHAGEQLDQARAAVPLLNASEGLHYIRFPVMGGFNNQRQCLINSVVALSLLPRAVAVLPPATPLPYPVAERWPHDYAPPYSPRTLRWLPWGTRAGWANSSRAGSFDTLWDPQGWFESLRAAGLRTVAAAPRVPGQPHPRQLPLIADLTGCTYTGFLTDERCLRLDRSKWEPFRVAVKAWAALLEREPPAEWHADALCYQVAEMEGSDEGCAAQWGARICDAAFGAVRPNAVATAAATLVLSLLAGVGSWAAVHFQEDWKCRDTRANFVSALSQLANGTTLYLAGGAAVPEDVAESLAERRVRSVSKEDALPGAAQRLPYEIAGQVDWLVTSAAPGPFFYFNYPVASSFDVYARQERRRRRLPSVGIELGHYCRLVPESGFVDPVARMALVQRSGRHKHLLPPQRTRTRGVLPHSARNRRNRGR
eukprot:TRINITY_DN8611_c0_g1_i1.p1 TRINITY_DN8611_c0_g1~~TRINITY_DN8611_c0_g1_i1.p1  ORF type:complete len:572 (+),score=175.77 TRINITY_DN8611_c0_g1_i1:78-1718(+)